MSTTKQKSKWPRRLLIIFIIIFVIVTVITGLLYQKHKPLPQGQAGPEAEALTDNMLMAINHQAWLNTGAVAWTFRESHTFIWDKERHLTQVVWADNKVLLNINSKTGRAWQNGVELQGEAANELLRLAYEYWANDSFWLNAPNKVRDGGTSRELVTLANGTKGLLVKYSTGGVTPGDAYLWLLDDAYKPIAWQMWVNIIPIGGLEFSWQQWEELPTGALVATFHESSLLNIPITGLNAAATLTELTDGRDIFAPLF